MLTPIYIYTLSSRSCTPQTRSCPSRLTAIIANRRYRCTSNGTVRKSSSRVKASRFQAQGRTLRLFGTDLMRDAIIRRRSPRVILLSYPLYHKHHSYFAEGERRQIDISRVYGSSLRRFETETPPCRFSRIFTRSPTPFYFDISFRMCAPRLVLFLSLNHRVPRPENNNGTAHRYTLRRNCLLCYIECNSFGEMHRSARASTTHNTNSSRCVSVCECRLAGDE